jgi:phospholipid/cholesterol/gamma-HCH transport system permease protein
MTPQAPPTLTLTRNADGVLAGVHVGGSWRVHQLAQAGTLNQLKAAIKAVPKKQILKIEWDLLGVDGLDYIGAQLLWNEWGRQRPARLRLTQAQDSMFLRLAQIPPPPRSSSLPSVLPLVAAVGLLGLRILRFGAHLRGFVTLIGQVMLDLLRFARNPVAGPWTEISANIYHAGFRALGITALVGFLIGVVFSYLSAQQLRSFGADTLVVNILGLSVIRELGPILTAILVAGRSGSAITAQLGVMRVTEELDAMLVMGIPHGFRLIMPKVVALAIAVPLLVVWTDVMALSGGILSAQFELGLSPAYFLHALPGAVPVVNYWIGEGKGVMFGILIALVSCHFGLRILPNTESLGQGTTTSVVTAITVVIVADALFALVFNGVGY